MICIFDKFATDFSGNGIGPLCPSSCEVSETLNGKYELTMVHPLDELGKWQRIDSGRILRVSVPSAMTPHVNLITQPATEIYKTNGSSRSIRSSTSTKGKVLAKYKKNKQVALIEKTSRQSSLDQPSPTWRLPPTAGTLSSSTNRSDGFPENTPRSSDRHAHCGFVCGGRYFTFRQVGK